MCGSASAPLTPSPTDIEVKIERTREEIQSLEDKKRLLLVEKVGAIPRARLDEIHSKLDGLEERLHQKSVSLTRLVWKARRDAPEEELAQTERDNAVAVEICDRVFQRVSSLGCEQRLSDLIDTQYARNAMEADRLWKEQDDKTEVLERQVQFRRQRAEEAQEHRSRQLQDARESWTWAGAIVRFFVFGF